MPEEFHHDRPTKSAEVIYGDTDSVMIRFFVKEVATSIYLAKKAATIINKVFDYPIKLEFEKVFKPYLLINKKRYVGKYFYTFIWSVIGLLYTKPDKPDKMSAKGIESVRRDNCLLTSQTVSEVSRILMIDRDVTKAVNYVKNIISNLLQNKIGKYYPCGELT